MTPRQRTSLIVAVAMLAFGLLTFALGVLIGLTLAGGPVAAVTPAASAGTAAAPGTPAGAGTAGTAAPAPAAAGASPPATAAPSGAPATAPAGAPPAPGADAAPTVAPVKVKGFAVGPPASEMPKSPLVGKLLAAAAEPAPAAAAGGGAAGPAAPPPAAPAAAGPAYIFSVSIGRYLLVPNAAGTVARATSQGYAPVVVVSDPPDPAGWMTVTLGPQADQAAAGRLVGDAAAQGFRAELVSWLAAK